MNTKTQGRAWLAAAGLATGILTGTGWSEAPTLEELDQKVRVLERRYEVDREQAETKVKQAARVEAGKGGSWLRSADKAFALRVGGDVQVDGRGYLGGRQAATSDTFLLRRVRLNAQGKLSDWAEFRVMPNFGGGKAEIQDAYLDIVYWSSVQVRAGKFKAPVGLEVLQSPTDHLFPELAFPSALVPVRDVGLQVHGEVLNGRLAYAVGVFNGVADGASGDGDANDRKETEARLFAQPFRNGSVEPLAGLGVGAAATYGREEGALPSFKTAGQQTFFTYGSSVAAGGTRVRIVPQLYYAWGPLGLLSEYVRSEQTVWVGKKSLPAANVAWQVAVSYALSGDDASYRGLKPRRPFDPRKGAWGGYELVGRYSDLRVDPVVFTGFADRAKSAERARSWAVGVNWLLTANVKIQLDHAWTTFTGGGKTVDRDRERAVFTRFQAVF